MRLDDAVTLRQPARALEHPRVRCQQRQTQQRAGQGQMAPVADDVGERRQQHVTDGPEADAAAERSPLGADKLHGQHEVYHHRACNTSVRTSTNSHRFERRVLSEPKTFICVPFEFTRFSRMYT